jgi:hypothetical protein
MTDVDRDREPAPVGVAVSLARAVFLLREVLVAAGGVGTLVSAAAFAARTLADGLDWRLARGLGLGVTD